MKVEIERAPSEADTQLLSRAIMTFNDETVHGLEPVADEKQSLPETAGKGPVGYAALACRRKASQETGCIAVPAG